MDSLLNKNRPPAFCPGCTHEKIIHALNQSFQNMELSGSEIALISDIGCSGLFDTFFNTHALHGLHGRALTYATGLKMARPDLTVIVTMGDGGLGIGGAHLLAACRRNLDLTLIILNNFNFGMTGGQYSATTPPDAHVGSGFLNQLEKPLDIVNVTRSAGAGYVIQCSGYSSNLSLEIEMAIRFPGFSVMDICGICTGRYTKKNRLSPRIIEDAISKKKDAATGAVYENKREEFGGHYRKLAAAQIPAEPPDSIEACFMPPQPRKHEVIILGSAGQRIITAGEILCFAGLSGGLKATQKNEYNITVLRGPSITELILSPDNIDYTGIDHPSIVIALDQEGVDRRSRLFEKLTGDTLIIQSIEVKLPPCSAVIYPVNFHKQGIESGDYALTSIALLAGLNLVISRDMLEKAVEIKFREPLRSSTKSLIQKVQADKHLLKGKFVQLM